MKVVELFFIGEDKPTVFTDAMNTYQEGSFYCIEFATKTMKYPLARIIKITEF